MVKVLNANILISFSKNYTEVINPSQLHTFYTQQVLIIIPDPVLCTGCVGQTVNDNDLPHLRFERNQ